VDLNWIWKYKLNKSFPHDTGIPEQGHYTQVCRVGLFGHLSAALSLSIVVQEF